ncbi:hypothetical protein [Sporosarcina sp. Te-1]|uniref:hypothetical protein n=1 Tax=Sporosarcina sp. Te-1 TaxID=2818390 RepID=UPI001A9E3223|nr:hypothetical protein [Sporosarcina sp. Te-1]QTD40059.1 hypothetical protein J3U78_14665 [Sporosarcina sp. Te-1]
MGHKNGDKDLLATITPKVTDKFRKVIDRDNQLIDNQLQVTDKPRLISSLIKINDLPICDLQTNNKQTPVKRLLVVKFPYRDP